MQVQACSRSAHRAAAEPARAAASAGAPYGRSQDVSCAACRVRPCQACALARRWPARIASVAAGACTTSSNLRAGAIVAPLGRGRLWASLLPWIGHARAGRAFAARAPHRPACTACRTRQGRALRWHTWPHVGVAQGSGCLWQRCRRGARAARIRRPAASPATAGRPPQAARSSGHAIAAGQRGRREERRTRRARIGTRDTADTSGSRALSHQGSCSPLHFPAAWRPWWACNIRNRRAPEAALEARGRRARLPHLGGRVAIIHVAAAFVHHGLPTRRQPDAERGQIRRAARGRCGRGGCDGGRRGGARCSDGRGLGRLVAPLRCLHALPPVARQRLPQCQGISAHGPVLEDTARLSRSPLYHGDSAEPASEVTHKTRGVTGLARALRRWSRSARHHSNPLPPPHVPRTPGARAPPPAADGRARCGAAGAVRVPTGPSSET